MKVMVLGGGAQGSAAAFDLLRTEGVGRVVLADREGYRPPRFLEGEVGGGRLEVVSLDARDAAAVRRAMEGVSAVACALPYFFGYEMADAAVSAGAHYCDLGGNTEIVERQRGLADRARAAGVSVVPDCGLAPGMVNILAQAAIDALDEVDSVKLLVGGLPQRPKPPLNYQVVYSLEGVIDYYTTPSIVLAGGQIEEREALSELEHVHFDGVGTLEAFHTAGGVSTMPHRYLGKIPSMEYKTLRYPGHAEIMRAFRGLGFFETEPRRLGGCEVAPRRAFIDLVGPKITDADSEDLVVLRVEAKGRKDGAEHTVRYDVLDRYDRDNRITAMMRTTGYSLALTAVMQARRQIEAGVHTPDEAVPAEPYVEGLRARGVEIRREG